MTEPQNSGTIKQIITCDFFCGCSSLFWEGQWNDSKIYKTRNKDNVVFVSLVLWFLLQFCPTLLHYFLCDDCAPSIALSFFFLPTSRCLFWMCFGMEAQLVSCHCSVIIKKINRTTEQNRIYSSNTYEVERKIRIWIYKKIHNKNK